MPNERSFFRKGNRLSMRVSKSQEDQLDVLTSNPRGVDDSRGLLDKLLSVDFTSR